MNFLILKYILKGKTNRGSKFNQKTAFLLRWQDLTVEIVLSRKSFRESSPPEMAPLFYSRIFRFVHKHGWKHFHLPNFFLPPQPEPVLCASAGASFECARGVPCCEMVRETIRLNIKIDKPLCHTFKLLPKRDKLLTPHCGLLPSPQLPKPELVLGASFERERGGACWAIIWEQIC